MPVVSIANAEHYRWGDGCDGWRLLDDPGLSVIRERVPPGKSEVRHLHRRARQFFLILEGRAVMEIEGQDHPLSAGQGIHVPAGAAHQFKNPTDQPVEFLVVSSPTTRGDRENVG